MDAQTDNRKPLPLRRAATVLARLQPELPVASFNQVSRLLPRVAMALSRAGMECDEETLTHAGLQGEKHLRTTLRDLKASTQQPPDYATIVAGLKPAAIIRLPEENLAQHQLFEKALVQNDLALIMRLSAADALDWGDTSFYRLVADCAVKHRNRPMLDYAINQLKGARPELAERPQAVLRIAAASAFMLHDIGAAGFLQQAGMSVDTVFSTAYSCGCQEIMEQARQQDPTLPDRYRDLLCDPRPGFGFLNFDYMLKHTAPADEDEAKAIFQNYLTNSVICPDLAEVKQLLNLPDGTLTDMLPLVANNDQKFQALHKLGADLTADAHAGVRTALEAGNPDVLYYIQQTGIDLRPCATTPTAAHNLTVYEQKMKWQQAWLSENGHEAPISLRWQPPRPWSNATYEYAEALMAAEKGSMPYASAMCAQLFSSPLQLARYIQRWSEDDGHPVMSVTRSFEMPAGPFDGEAWGAALLKHGPEMGRALKWAHHLPVPCSTVQATREALTPYMYPRAAEHPEMASFFARRMLAPDDFARALDAYTAQQARGFPEKNIPDLVIPGETFGMPGGRFRRLPPDDFRGLVLGEIVGCCQSVGSDGETCALTGFTSTQSGFYVVEDAAGQIVAQSWAWRGQQDELVFDSLEYAKKDFTPACWPLLLQQVSAALQSNSTAHNVSAFFVGQGGDTPKDLPYLPVIPAQPADHAPYEDSAKQYAIWTSPAYAKELTAKRYNALIAHTPLRMS